MKIFNMMIGLMFATILCTGPALAWRALETDKGFAVIHADDDVRFALACSPDRQGGLLVRIVGPAPATVGTITMKMTQSNGRVTEYTARPIPRDGDITGFLGASDDFLTDFSSGIRFKLEIDGTTYMDTDMDGTADARAALRSACGV